MTVWAVITEAGTEGGAQSNSVALTWSTEHKTCVGLSYLHPANRVVEWTQRFRLCHHFAWWLRGVTLAGWLQTHPNCLSPFRNHTTTAKMHHSPSLKSWWYLKVVSATSWPTAFMRMSQQSQRSQFPHSSCRGSQTCAASLKLLKKVCEIFPHKIFGSQTLHDVKSCPGLKNAPVINNI